MNRPKILTSESFCYPKILLSEIVCNTGKYNKTVSVLKLCNFVFKNMYFLVYMFKPTSRSWGKLQ